MFPRFVQRIYAYLKPIAIHYKRTLSSYARAKWQIWGPRVDRLMQASIAISTATSTFKLSVEIIPILLSMLTVMATAPWLSGFMPAFVLDQTVIFFTVLGVAAIAGYHKFKELVLRAKLDVQIKKNTAQGKYFETKMKIINKRLTKLENNLLTKNTPFSPNKSQTPAFRNSLRSRSAPSLLESNQILKPDLKYKVG